MAWQTIDTAPTDGTVVDIWAEGERVIDAWFQKGDWLTSDGEWVSQHEPTHWMPVPQPPEGETDGADRHRMRVLGNLQALAQNL